MDCCYLDLYADFTCLAGRCPSTCCAGWEIVVDREAGERFAKLDQEELRRDILAHLREKSGKYRFENRPDGTCPMLDEDGLCRIQKKLGEKALCNTCRKFPRLSARVDGEVWLSMAASCPVVADYLWKEKPAWIRQEKDGRRYALDWREIRPVAEGMALYRHYCGLAGRKRGKRYRTSERESGLAAVRENGYRFGLFLELVDGCVGLMTEFREQTYLEGSFSYFEQEDREVQAILCDMQEFSAVWQRDFFVFVGRYLPYRLFSRYLEYREETVERRCSQALGELALIYLILFSRYQTGELTDEGRIEVVNRVYRFCAHGLRLSGKVSALFGSVFCEPENYIRFMTSYK